MKTYMLSANIGRVKYLVSFSDGIKKHIDKSLFSDIRTFSAKPKRDDFIKSLKKIRILRIMKNKIVAYATFGPVYDRKIHVSRKSETPGETVWVYAWSTNAAKTCKAAIADANKKYPFTAFCANFAKD